MPIGSHALPLTAIQPPPAIRSSSASLGANLPKNESGDHTSLGALRNPAGLAGVCAVPDSSQRLLRAARKGCSLASARREDGSLVLELRICESVTDHQEQTPLLDRAASWRLHAPEAARFRNSRWSSLDRSLHSFILQANCQPTVRCFVNLHLVRTWPLPPEQEGARPQSPSTADEPMTLHHQNQPAYLSKERGHARAGMPARCVGSGQRCRMLTDGLIASALKCTLGYLDRAEFWPRHQVASP